MFCLLLNSMGATLFVQPLDLIKNRMQLSGEGGGAKEHKTSLHAFRSILKNEGISGLYTGLSAGLLRQASYTTVRMGVYTSLFEWASGKFGSNGLGFYVTQLHYLFTLLVCLFCKLLFILTRISPHYLDFKPSRWEARIYEYPL